MAQAVVRTAIAGVRGKMGRAAAAALTRAPGVRFVGGLTHGRADPSRLEYDELDMLIEQTRPAVLVDFTSMPGSLDIVLHAVRQGVRPVIGTSGYRAADLNRLRAACRQAGVGAVHVPNFAIGAVLMMRFAEIAAKHFTSADIIEIHHAGKKDAPSGTARATAGRIGAARLYQRRFAGRASAGRALGATIDGVGVHSLRLKGIVASQEVLFGGEAETLSIRHETYSRESFMAGVLAAVRAASTLTHCVEGLEELL
ncbi:MAG: 4-hydroxy-tetrahydrodipicolinate reductase [Candidatus Eremiobacteraeota bacterium]|nr:4-hydroxy-tetrahydrodipicolinate reductase [Candidatus Eremiobacteraeota bacterium]MBC5827727.1 4-hydroxy-tetrahydrodipicolinate reductase [Candidatus Eremiobacteraeota bacterium]